MMKSKFIAATLFAALVFSPSVSAAATDFYLKLDGVDGESSPPPPPPPPPPQNAPAPTQSTITVGGALQVESGTFNTTKAPPPPPPSPSGDPDFDLLRVAPPPSPSLNPVYQESGNTGSNPMYEGKGVAPAAPPVKLPPGDPDFDLLRVAPEGGARGGPVDDGVILLNKDEESSGGVNIAVGDLDGDGLEDLIVSEPAGRAAGFIKFDGVDGESNDSPSDASKGKNIRKNITVNLRAADLRDADEETKREVLSRVPTTTDAVLTGDDLALFILSEAASDPAMEQVSFNFEKIEMKHRAKGKLFGFIPITFTERVEVDTSEGTEPGTVKVKLPWYGFLVNEDVRPEEVEAEAKKGHKEWIDVESWSWGMSQRAAMFQSISNVLKTKHDTAKNSIGNMR